MIKRIFILCLLLICPITSSVQDSVKVYIKEGNIWKGAFTEPFEILYLLCDNGDFYGMTTRDEGTIRVHAIWIRDFLETKGHEMDDVIYIIHNHFADPFLSPNNMLFLKAMRRLGFVGTFSMMDTATGKVVSIRNGDG